MHIRKWLFSAVGKPTSLRMGNKKRLISIVKKQNWPGRESGFQTARRVYRKNLLTLPEIEEKSEKSTHFPTEQVCPCAEISRIMYLMKQGIVRDFEPTGAEETAK